MRRMAVSLLMLVTVSCASPARQTYVGSGQRRTIYMTRSAWGEWNGLKLGMTRDEARRLLGKPYQVNHEGDSVGEFWCYEPCRYVTFRDGEVSGWLVPSELRCQVLMRPS